MFTNNYVVDQFDCVMFYVNMAKRPTHKNSRHNRKHVQQEYTKRAQEIHTQH